jgi:hypothetical protein
LFYHEWERPLKAFGEDKDEVRGVKNTIPPVRMSIIAAVVTTRTSQDQKLMFGMIFSLKQFSQKIGNSG